MSEYRVAVAAEVAKRRRYIEDPVEIRKFRIKLLKSWGYRAITFLRQSPLRLYRGVRRLLIETTLYCALISVWFLIFGIMLFVCQMVEAALG